MVKGNRKKLSLTRPTTYQIKVPGLLDESWSDWDGEITITIDSDVDGLPVTTLTGNIDQAALHGLLRRLYSLGLPLISVIWVESGSGK
jgi:hypothetical protein